MQDRQDNRMSRREFLQNAIAIGTFGAFYLSFLKVFPEIIYGGRHLPWADNYKPSKIDCLEGKVKTGVFNRDMKSSNPRFVSNPRDQVVMTYAEYAHIASENSEHIERARVQYEITTALRQGRKKKGLVHLGLEPAINWPAIVCDNESLHEFARLLEESNLPVALRFGAEMNGKWTKWHSDPEQYKKAFQIVARVMHENAPRVKMLWAPTPDRSANKKCSLYYPGDEFVDAIGTSAYFTPIYPFNTIDGAKDRNMKIDDLASIILKPISEFAKAHGKPFVIAEFGAAANYNNGYKNLDWSEFQEQAIIKMYSKFVKAFSIRAICYYNGNPLGNSTNTKSWAITQELYNKAIAELKE